MKRRNQLLEFKQNLKAYTDLIMFRLGGLQESKNAGGKILFLWLAMWKSNLDHEKLWLQFVLVDTGINLNLVLLTLHKNDKLSYWHGPGTWNSLEQQQSAEKVENESSCLLHIPQNPRVWRIFKENKIIVSKWKVDKDSTEEKIMNNKWGSAKSTFSADFADSVECTENNLIKFSGLCRFSWISADSANQKEV